MKVLLLGATGNLGSRILPALLTHGHSVVAYVRSSNKLQSLLPAPVYERVTVVQGDATDSIAIKKAILDNKCDAVVQTAGVAALPPWGKGNLPQIFRAALDGVREAGKESNSQLRAWFLGGLGVLYYPGTQSMLSNYVPIFLEHRGDVHLLRTLPPNTIDWSMFCPTFMTPESSDLSVPTKSSQGKLVANGPTPPNWRHSWLSYIPLLGRTIDMAINAGRYDITLEQAAEFIASDFDDGHESRWVGMTVGVIDPTK